MRWRPRLVVRFGRGGSVSSPTSTAGYVLVGSIATSLLLGLIAAAVKSRDFVPLVGMFIPLLFLRDTWAWFAASEEERRAFRAEVETLTKQGLSSPDKPINVRWSPAVFAGLFAVMAGSIALIAHGYPAAFLSLFWSLALTTVGMLDVVRARRNRPHRP